jgi:hypothetical protein
MAGWRARARSISPPPFHRGASSAMLQFGEGTNPRCGCRCPRQKSGCRAAPRRRRCVWWTRLRSLRGADFSADEVAAVLDFGRFSVAGQSGEGQVNITVGAIGSANEMVARAVAGGVTIAGDIRLAKRGRDQQRADSCQLRGRVISGLKTSFVKRRAISRVNLSGQMRSAVLSAQADAAVGGPDPFFRRACARCGRSHQRRGCHAIVI